MSLKAEVALDWGDGNYLFALKGAQIEELQSKCGNAGFGTIFNRVILGQWFWGDLYHTVRLGLIGGANAGIGAVEAKRLVDTYIGPTADEARAPLAKGPNSPLSVATAILNATMFGMESIPSGEAAAGEAPAPSSTSPDIEPPSSMQE